MRILKTLIDKGSIELSDAELIAKNENIELDSPT